MIEGACHCGKVRWTLERAPTRATACSCTLCRRYGGLWAHDDDEGVHITGETLSYCWGDLEMDFFFCGTCGCNTHSRVRATNDEGRHRVSVNLRMAEPHQVREVAVRRFDGFDTWSDLPDEGRLVGDVWF